MDSRFSCTTRPRVCMCVHFPSTDGSIDRPGYKNTQEQCPFWDFGRDVEIVRVGIRVVSRYYFIILCIRAISMNENIYIYNVEID